MTAAWHTVRGVIRRFRPDRNPLRRTADRVEAAILAGLVVVLLAAAPLAGRAAVGLAAAAGTRAGHAQAAWHQTDAVLLRNAPEQPFARTQALQEPVVPARWTAPDGTRHEGQVRAPGLTRAGTTVPVWTNPSGVLEESPVQQANVIVWEALAVLAVVAGGVAVAAGGAFLVRYVLDRRRLAAWDAAWPLVEPRWSGRR